MSLVAAGPAGTFPLIRSTRTTPVIQITNPTTRRPAR